MEQGSKHLAPAPRARSTVLALLWLAAPLACLPAHGAETGTQGGPAGALLVTTPALPMPPSGTPLPGQVLPPLPSLASLPPAVDLPEGRAASRTRAGRKAAHAPAPRPATLDVRMVVSDESRHALGEIAAQLDEALKK